MAYYYVKDDPVGDTGTATGDGGRVALQRTGTWSTTLTEFYPSIHDAFAATTAPGDGDVICVSDLHDHAGSTLLGMNTHSTGGDEFVRVISVDDANQENYKKGAKEASSNTGDVRANGNTLIMGIHFEAGDDFMCQGTGAVTFIDCELDLKNAGSVIECQTNRRSLALINCTITNTYTTSASNLFFVNNGSGVRMVGGSVVDGTGSFGYIVSHGYGSSARFYNVDFSGATFGSNYLCLSESPNTDSGTVTEFHNCALPTSGNYGGFTQYDLNTYAGSILFSGCGSTNTEALYQYYYAGAMGDVEATTAIYRNDSTPVADDSTKISLKAVTSPTNDAQYPFVFDLPTRFVDLGDAGSDVIKIHLASTATLSKEEVFAEVYYADSTSTYKSNIARSVTNGFATDFNNSTGNLASDGASDWRDGASALSGYNEYEIELDLSTNGEACVPLIRLYIAKASTTVYVCPTLTVS